MIPFLIITPQEFKKILCLGYSPIKYLKFIVLYLLYATFFYLFLTYDFGLIVIRFSDETNIPYLFLFVVSFIIILNKIIKFLLVRIPEQPKDDEIMDEGFKSQTSVLIPCHNSQDVIEDSIKSIIVHYYPQNVYIVENDNRPMPKNSIIEDICNKYNVNYIYVPRGNKSNAMKYGLASITTKYVLTMDDDTMLPEKFCPKEDMFLEDERVAGISFIIKMRYRNSLIRRLVDFDYLMFNYSNYTQNYSTNKLLVGIAALYKTELYRLQNVINPATDMLPYGEDGYAGMILRLNNYKIKQDFRNHVLSYCPDKLFFSLQEIVCGGNPKCISGYNATNIWKQRSLRWFRSSYTKLLVNLYLFFTYISKGKTCMKTILENIHYRIVNIYSFMLIYFAISVLYQLYYNINTIEGSYNLQINKTTLHIPKLLVDFLLIHSGLYITNILFILYYKFIMFRKRSDIQITFDVVLLYPLFLIYLFLVRVFGFFGFLLYYLPFHIDIEDVENYIGGSIICEELRDDLNLFLQSKNQLL